MGHHLDGDYPIILMSIQKHIQLQGGAPPVRNVGL